MEDSVLSSQHKQKQYTSTSNYWIDFTCLDNGKRFLHKTAWIPRWTLLLVVACLPFFHLYAPILYLNFSPAFPIHSFYFLPTTQYDTLPILNKGSYLLPLLWTSHFENLTYVCFKSCEHISFVFLVHNSISVYDTYVSYVVFVCFTTFLLQYVNFKNEIKEFRKKGSSLWELQNSMIGQSVEGEGLQKC